MAAAGGRAYVGAMNEMSTTPDSQGRDYRRVARAIDYVVRNRLEQPDLAEVADAVGLSPYHFQRLFTRWAGVSPKKFLQYVTLGDAKERLDASASVLDAALDAGLSGPGRLHDLFVAVEAVTPGEYKARGRGLDFAYGFHPSPFGECLLVASPRGLTGLGFVEDGDRAACLAHQRKGWENAQWRRDQAATAAVAIFSRHLVDFIKRASALLLRNPSSSKTEGMSGALSTMKPANRWGFLLTRVLAFIDLIMVLAK